MRGRHAGRESMEAGTPQYVKQTANRNLLFDSGNPNKGSLTPRGVGKGGR